jgi:hypothetical protein
MAAAHPTSGATYLIGSMTDVATFKKKEADQDRVALPATAAGEEK